MAKVDLNSCSEKALCDALRIRAETAKKIVQLRPFQSSRALLVLPYFTPDKYERIKGNVFASQPKQSKDEGVYYEKKVTVKTIVFKKSGDPKKTGNSKKVGNAKKPQDSKKPANAVKKAVKEPGKQPSKTPTGSSGKQPAARKTAAPKTNPKTGPSKGAVKQEGGWGQAPLFSMGAVKKEEGWGQPGWGRPGWGQVPPFPPGAYYMPSNDSMDSSQYYPPY